MERLRDYCKAHAWDIAAEYEEPDASGGDESRPKLELALQAACQHKGVLLVHSLSRLARNTRHCLNIAERLQLAGADLASVKDHIDTSTPTGRCLFTMIAAFNQLEREQTSERTSDAIRRKMASGVRWGAPLGRAKPFGRDGNYSNMPYGMCPDPNDPKRMIQDKREQASIELIRQLRSTGMSLRAITRYLNSHSIYCRGEQVWHPTQVQRLTKDIKVSRKKYGKQKGRERR